MGFPARAGIDPRFNTLYIAQERFPRPCGDRPSLLCSEYSMAAVSPPVRG